MTGSRLRLVACGSVGDGKRTLLERLAGGPAVVPDDDAAQGAASDVTCRRFASGGREFVIADVPGDERQTRGILAGGSTADLAIILVDARRGVDGATRRQIYLVSILGVRRAVLVVNKMDLVAHPAEAFAAIERDYRDFASRIALEEVHCIPVSAARGDNVAQATADMPWYRGPSLIGVLESIAVDAAQRPVDEPVETADQFEATLVWLGEAPLLPGRNYLMKAGQRTVTATVAPLRYRINVDTLERVAAEKLARDEIGVCQLELDRAVAFEPYAHDRELGGFVLIDAITSRTVAAGLIHFALRRAHNVHWQALDVDRAARARQKGQRPCVVWFTGLSGAGKSTIANLVERKLHAMGRHTYLLDGDNVRHGLNKDLGFTEQARVENIRRVAEVARLMADAGLIVLAAFISPFRSERRMARTLLPPGEFVEVFVDVPLAVAEQRDPKGLYRKARRGDLKNFTGIDSPYEPPENAEVTVDTSRLSAEAAAERVVEEMRRRGL